MNKAINEQSLLPIDARSREIFRLIVESYLKDGEPVGSRNLSRMLPTSLSPATVRNVMSDLEDLGLIYCLATFPFGFGCCVLTALGDQVAQARGIPHGIAKSCLCACCDGYCCYSCSVVNESRLYKEQSGGGAPKGEGMNRK